MLYVFENSQIDGVVLRKVRSDILQHTVVGLDGAGRRDVRLAERFGQPDARNQCGIDDDSAVRPVVGVVLRPTGHRVAADEILLRIGRRTGIRFDEMKHARRGAGQIKVVHEVDGLRV